MKKKLMLAAIAAVVGVGGFAGFNAFQNNSSTSDILLANAEALTDLENLDGKWYVIENIPCSSHASEFRLDCSYVNCTTCKKEKGRVESEDGECLNIRPVGVLD